ncbi:MAG TPA: hypothetical protein VNO30_05480 [Kofleriaceae bacterium]|nr:hypothetical protein [Kofleriaceae bacterium]
MTDAKRVEQLESQASATLSFADLDAQLRLKIRSTLGLCFPILYAEFARNIDVASMRRQGIASVITAVDVERTLTPLPVGGKLDVDVAIRMCDFAAGAIADGRRRLGFEVRLELRAVPGTGDPLRYRDAAPGAERVVCGRSTVLLALLRPAAPLIERLISDPPPEVAHMAVLPLAQPHPSAESLAEIPAGFAELARRDRAAAPRVWGLHNSDVNQNVFTGNYVEAMEDTFSELLHGAGQDVGGHQIDRATLVLKKPFAAGSVAAIHAAAHRSEDRTLLVATLHGVGTSGDYEVRPSIVGRLEGRLGVTRGDPRFAA